MDTKLHSSESRSRKVRRHFWGRKKSDMRGSNISDTSTTPLDHDISCNVETDSSTRGCLKVSEHKKQPEGDRKKKSVMWADIEIRTHAVILGDNPSITAGPPLTIDWKSCHSSSMSIDYYEKYRPERREKHEMLVPKSMRESWLRDEGYSRGELKQAENRALSIAKQRALNAKPGLMEKVRLVAGGTATPKLSAMTPDKAAKTDSLRSIRKLVGALR